MFNHCPREIFESSKNDPALIDRRFLQVLNGHSQIRPSTTFLFRKTISVPHWHRCLDASKQQTTNLVRTKCEAIKTLEKRLVEAKKLIASLKQELQSARNSSSVTEPQHPDPPQQQSTHVSSHSLSSIHSRYDKVLQTMNDNNCSMANAYRLSGCPRSTLRDFIAIAELKKVDSRAFEIALASYQGESVRELEKMCRKSLGRYMPLMSTMRREGQLLPLKFDQRFYE